MVQLSVNLNKVATLRNSRGGNDPDLLHSLKVCLDAGVRGITVHPREDERHITAQDVVAVSEALQPVRDTVEYNIEGDPRPDLLDRIVALRPHQCTLVPVRPGEVTSEAGWPASTPRAELAGHVQRLKDAGVRVSVFVDPKPEPIEWAADLGADRVELYTEPFARAHGAGQGQESFADYVAAAELAHGMGLGINAGHDLNLDNLPLFRTLPYLDEVSIGHALISRALFVGLDTVVREYLDVLAGN